MRKGSKKPQWTTNGHYLCPQDEAHGPLLLLESGKLYCPNVKHKGQTIYQPQEVAA